MSIVTDHIAGSRLNCIDGRWLPAVDGAGLEPCLDTKTVAVALW